jgi:hypothetical protein
MTIPNGTPDKKKGRSKRLSLMIPVLGAIILIPLKEIYPLVPTPDLAILALLPAMAIATIFNFLYERRKR